MEEKYRECKRCLLLASGEEETLELVKRHIAKIPPDKRTPESAYRERLSRCEACDSLAGGTCLKCGCYPEFRAAFRDKRCPADEW